MGHVGLDGRDIRNRWGIIPPICLNLGSSSLHAAGMIKNLLSLNSMIRQH